MNDSIEPTLSEKLSLKRAVLWAALFLSLGFLLVAVWMASYGLGRIGQGEKSAAVVYIPKGTSVRGISSILGEAGLIKDDIRFLVWAKLRGVSTRFRAGEFSIATGRTPLEVMDLLLVAKPLQHPVTIPEGLTAEEIAAIFSEGGWCEKAEYVELVRDPSFIEKAGFAGLGTLEGYLYPDTYYLTRDFQGADKVIALQLKRFREVWSEVVRDVSPVPDMQDTIILASIIEKETGDSAERSLIASVFHNRLRKGMRLQSDPTVTYGIENFSGPITKTHLRTPTPYNTYVITGLPAGPIANPGRASVAAVLSPEQTNYLYFVSKNDGTHQFSENLRDHNRAVRKYQRKKKSKNGKE